MDRTQDSHTTLVSASPFFPTRAARVELARRRFFDEGIVPTGIVSDAVFQSWARCQRLCAQPAAGVMFQPVTASRTHLALRRSRPLLEAWFEELPALEALLGTSSCTAMLTDATGVLIGATRAGRPHEHVMSIATRLGVDLSEEAVGTTAPGVVVRTGQSVAVHGSEHYFDALKGMHCAAAPVRDTQGCVAGVLDISSESVPFGFDAAAVVGCFADAIENRLLILQSQEHLVVSLQMAPSLLDSAVAGLVGVDAAGEVAWCNGVAARLLGLPAPGMPSRRGAVEPLLGAGTSVLASLPGHGAAVLRLPNGLAVWARAVMRAPDGRRNLVPLQAALAPRAEQSTLLAASDAAPLHDGLAVGPGVPMEAANSPHVTGEQVSGSDSAHRVEPSASLRASDRDLIERTVRECGGNISTAARRLRVSRGLIYRRLRGLPSQSATG